MKAVTSDVGGVPADMGTGPKTMTAKSARDKPALRHDSIRPMPRTSATRLGIAAVLALACGCAAAPQRVTGLTIVADPRPFGSIEEAAGAEARVDWWDADPRDDDACTRCFAALELARFLPPAFGLPPGAVKVATAMPDTGDVIEVGGADALPRADRPRRGESVSWRGKTQGFRLESERRGRARLLIVAGNDRAGTLYGAYALLERLGVRFPGLGDAEATAPAARAAWPERLDVFEEPAFATRGFWAWEPRANRDFILWMARNRMNLWTAADTASVPMTKKLGFQLTGGGHTIQSEFLSPAVYFRSHPEWFGLHGGQRSPAIHGDSGDNFCTSNAVARRTLAEHLVQALASGSLAHVDRLELWMLDQGRWCECDACRAQGSPTDRMLALASDVAEALERARRERRIVREVEVETAAYLETSAPPTRPVAPALTHAVTVSFFPYFRCDAHALGDSTCTEINRRLDVAYRGWDRVPLPFGVCEYYNVGAFKSLPLIFPHVMARDLARYARHASSFATMHAPTRALGCWALNHWLLAKLTWDPRADVDTLLNEFCADRFPAAAAAMREHYAALETASANIVALQASVGVYGASNGAAGRLASPRAPVYPLHHLQGYESHPPTDDGPDLDQIEAAMRAARAALDRAQRLASRPPERARLDEEARRFAYGEAMFAFYAGLLRTAEHERAGDTAAARASFAGVEQAARALGVVTDLVQVSASHANAANGLEASGVRGTYELFRSRYGR